MESGRLTGPARLGAHHAYAPARSSGSEPIPPTRPRTQAGLVRTVSVARTTHAHARGLSGSKVAILAVHTVTGPRAPAGFPPVSRDPLTHGQLHDLGERRRGDEDVLALLWEIKRLHGVLEQLQLRAHQLTMQLKKEAREDQTAFHLACQLGDAIVEEPGLLKPLARNRAAPKNETIFEHAKRHQRQADLEEARRLYPGLSDERALVKLHRDRRG